MHSETPWLGGVSSDELRRIVDALYRVHRFLAAITDLDTLLERVMEESKAVASAEACSLLLYDPQRNDLYFHVALGERGDQQALKRQIRLKLGQGIGGLAAEKRQSINVEDVRSFESWYRTADDLTQFDTKSLLAVPLEDHGVLIGVLELVNKQGGGAFTEADLRVMEIFATMVSTAIVNARLIEKNMRAERLAAIGEAVAGLSHYAKNILTGMSGTVDLIDQGLRAGNIEMLQRMWPLYRRNSFRLSTLVEDMLAFSKPREPVRTRCDVQQLIRDAVETFEELLIQKKVELVVDTSQAQGYVSIDPNGIHRCLLNLLSNAADAVPKEGGKVWVIARILPDETLHIEVADNGPGIPEELRERILEPFFSTKGSQGTGLGLAVTSKIIREHGGTLNIEKSQTGGALFRIVLPPEVHKPIKEVL